MTLASFIKMSKIILSTQDKKEIEKFLFKELSIFIDNGKYREGNDISLLSLLAILRYLNKGEERMDLQIKISGFYLGGVVIVNKPLNFESFAVSLLDEISNKE